MSRRDYLCNLLPEPLTDAIGALLSSMNDDNNRHGGLLSRETIRKADELRLVLSARVEVDLNGAAKATHGQDLQAEQHGAVL